MNEQTATAAATLPGVRRSLLENLESRRLMADFSAAINFQPNGTSTPAGMVADTGATYRSQNGLTYGWNTDNSSQTVARGRASSVEYDTLAGISTGGASKWEIAVPNGTYSVNILAGDAKEYDAKYVINAEGATVVNGTPDWGDRWDSGTATVTVSDGKLTVTAGSGAYNTKIDSIRINQLSAAAEPVAVPAATTAPAAPAGVSATVTGSSSVLIKWSDRASNEASYQILGAKLNGGLAVLATLPANSSSYAVTGLSAGTAYEFRVISVNSAGTGWSGRLTATTSGATTSTPAPAPTPTTTVSVPAVPTSVTAAATSSSSIKVSWGNVSNETGYVLEYCKDGGSWSQLATLGADVTSYTQSGLGANTKYYYRVSAKNSAGTSATSSVTSATTGGLASTPTTSTPSTPTTSTPAPSTGDGISTTVMSGIVNNELGLSVADPAMKAVGVKSVRLWYSVNDDWNNLNTYAIQRALDHKKAGYTVTLAVVAEHKTDYNTVKNYFAKLMANSTARAAVDYWEMGNEPNKSNYWNGSLKDFVTNFQKPAYEAIHAAGEKVIGGGVTWDANALKEMVGYGYLDSCDYAGFHPYGESGQIVADRIAAAASVVNGKPIIVTEWNIRLMTDANKWASDLNVAAKALSKYTVLSYYYALKYVDGGSTGRGGLVFDNGAKNTPFWDTFYNWTH